MLLKNIKFFYEIPRVFGIFPPVTGVGGAAIVHTCVVGEPFVNNQLH